MIINTLKKRNSVRKILNFIYYLRYLILFFIFSIIVLLSTPKLFNHVNKIDELNKTLKNQHGLIIKNTKKIKYKIFPQPNLEIKEALISLGKQYPTIKIKELKIFVNIKGLYASEEISFKKIKFKGNFLDTEVRGYYIPKENENYLYLKAMNLGIESKVFLDNKNKLPKPSGLIKLKILDNNLLINFNYDKNLYLKNSTYKNKNIYTIFRGQFNFEPFFYFKVIADVKKVNLDYLNLKKIYHLIFDEISNKKLNGEITINYLTKKALKKNIKKSKIDLIFKNGDIVLKTSNLQLANLNLGVNLDLKKYLSYKNLDYELEISTDDINKFYSVIGVKKNKSQNIVDALISGNINLDAQKFYFNKVVINKKKIDEKKLIKLKIFLDRNVNKYLDKSINEKNIYLLLKNLLEST